MGPGMRGDDGYGLEMNAYSPHSEPSTVALAGMWLSGWVRKRVEQEAFRRWFFVGLAVLGAQIVWKAAAGG